jgi:GNAT superfamily N-acetyltransferase
VPRRGRGVWSGLVTSPLHELTFRQATPRDASRLVALVIEGFETYRAFAPRGWSVPALVDESGRVATMLAKPSVWCQVADEGSRLAGHVGWLAAADSRIPVDDVGLAHFWQLFVRREWWGSGLATHLHAAALQEAVRRGFTTMRLYTPADNGRARRFYEREGWAPAGEPFDDEAFGMAIVEYRRAL